jgi:hypothetical protein
MARFQFNQHSITATLAARQVVSERTLRALDLTPDDDRPQGPGWFDSSWELIRGLEVNEAAPFDARVNDWFEASVRAANDTRTRSARSAHSTVTERHEQPRARFVPAAAHGALGHALQLTDLDFAVAAEVTHLDEFSEFGIDGLELL